MSTRLKGLVGIVVAAVALSLALLALLPAMAEAQGQAQEGQSQAPDTAGLPTEAQQNTTTDEKGAPAASLPAPEQSRHVVVNQGDSLWSISEEQIGPGATPQQIAYEVERIFEFNRDQIGEDPNLIFPGQEFVVPQPSAAAAVSEEVVAPQQAREPIVVESEAVFSDSPAPQGAVSQVAVPQDIISQDVVSEDAAPAPLTTEPTGEQDESAPAESAPAESTPADTAATSIGSSLLESYDYLKSPRRLLGLGILALTLLVAILMAWKPLMRKDVGDPAALWRQLTRRDVDDPGASWEIPRWSPEAPPEGAEGPEGESSSPASGPQEEATQGPSSARSSSPTSGVQGAGVPPAFTPSQGRLSRRRLRRIPQRRTSRGGWR